jgi:hypothetical protein
MIRSSEIYFALAITCTVTLRQIQTRSIGKIAGNEAQT